MFGFFRLAPTASDDRKQGISGLQKVYFPNALSTLGTHAFADCTNLVDIQFENGQHHPSGLTIESSVFTGCTQLPQDIIPKQTEASGHLNDGTSFVLYADGELVLSGTQTIKAAIKDEAILNSKIGKITKLTLDRGITEIENDVFKDLTALESVSVKEDAVRFGDYVFSGCTALNRIDNSRQMLGSFWI